MPENKPFPNVKNVSRRTSLRPEEKVLWDQVTKDVRKLSRKAAEPTKHEAFSSLPQSTQPHKASTQETKSVPTPSSEVHGWIHLETALPPMVRQSESGQSAYQMDAKLKKRAQKGELPLDGRIDLHGLTLEQAHRKFISFLGGHISKGSRFLLVVTGKGAGGEGVIRKNFPHWCEESVYARSILLLQQAAAKHGGAGAFYILLRRAK